MAKRTKSYGLNNPLQDIFPLPIIAERAPTTNDKGYELGQLWVDKSANKSWTLTSVSSGSATWALSSPGASEVDTLTGDSGGALSPAAGNLTLAGGTNLTSAGSGSTITFNMDAAITLATSVSSPIYTVAAATDMNINSASGQDIIMKMGDAAGANKVSFVDSASAEVFAIDSNGGLTFTSLTVTGAFTQTAGVVSISEDNSANAVGIANGTTARAVSIANSAAAHTVAIGSATGAASLDLKAGTGNFTLDGGTATTYTIGASTTTGTIDIGGTAQTGTITLGDSSGTNIVGIGTGEGATTINMATGATSAKTVNVATGAVANVVTIGSVTGAASLDLLCGTGNFTLEGDVASTYDISATGANTGTVTIAAGTGARTVNLATGGTGIKTVNIGTGAIDNVVTIGTVTGAASLDLLCGTGNFTLEGDVASTYDISSTGANTGTVTIAAGTGARTVNLATGGTGIKTVNIGTGAIDNVVTIGTVTGAASLDLLCGTGNFTLEGNTASTYDISGTGVNTGTITIGGGTGAQTLNMMDSTGGKTVTLATGAGANTVTIGSTDTTSSLTLQAGSGNITATGTFEDIQSKFVTRSGDSITFQQSPTTCTAADTAGVATGATGDLNLLGFQEGIIMEQFILGAGQTIIKPVMNSDGLLVSGDLVTTEGFEYNFGAARNNSRHAFTIGTSAAFFFEVSMKIADVSGGEPYMIGFRKVEANNATLANYTDYAMIGILAATSPTTSTILTELNSGGQTTTNTTDAWADAATHTLKILVSAAGVVTYTIDGIAPSVTAAFTFNTPDVVVPFIRITHNGNAGAVNLVSMACGFQ